MTKVKFRIIGDAISKNGRMVTVSIIESDSDLANKLLDLPKRMSKTFSNNDPIDKIYQSFVKDIKDEFKEFEKKKENKDLMSETFEIEVGT